MTIFLPDNVDDIGPLIRRTFSMAIKKYGESQVAEMCGVRPDVVLWWSVIPDNAEEQRLPTARALKAIRARLLSDMCVPR